MDMQSIQNFLSTTVSELAVKVLAAIAFWIVGRWLIGRVIAMMQAAMNRNHVDPTLTKYPVSYTHLDVYKRQLMISTEGVVSARLDEHSFLITPTGLDRGNLEIEDIVLIQDGQRERDKLPSRSVRLHAAIYDMHPDVNCVITAQSPNILAYAITHGPVSYTHLDVYKRQVLGLWTG